MSSLQLVGVGAAYVRVSNDTQDTARQFDSIKLFEERHGVSIAKQNWFQDRGWERDADKVRPEFNRLLQLARRREVRWIVVDSLDRFGTKNAKRLMGYLADLEDADCKLYDVSGKEWTGDDDGTEIQAWVAGKTSTREQKEKSKRCLGGMITKARAGEWMGGPPKLGFDVACFDKASGNELWRVIWEGREETDKEMRKGKLRPVYRVFRLKVYADGRTERFDGNVVFRTAPDTQVMRIVPTRDAAKLEAAQKLFERYATQTVSFFDLAKSLNGLSIRNSFGNKFQSNDVRKLLADEAYLGYPTFAKRRNGRFHRHDAEGGVTELESELYGKDTESDPADVIKSSTRLFNPLVDRPTWDAVQRKLRGREKSKYAPKNPDLYLAGLVVCAGCGEPMISRTDRMEYHCGTRDKHRVRGSLADSPCERNGVKQVVLEEYIARYLKETDTKLELMKAPPGGKHLTDPLRAQLGTAWAGFIDGIDRLTGYLAEHHPDEYNAILREHNQDPSMTPDDFVASAVTCYRTNFNPIALGAEIGRLEAEHTDLMKRWDAQPTPRAKAKAKAELVAAEGRIEELEKQRNDAAGVVERYHKEVSDLQMAVADARQAMKADSGVQALRRRAEKLRGVLVSIQCEFVSTGKLTAGPGNARSELVTISFHPIAGNVMILPSDDDRETNGGFRSYGKP